MADQLSKWLGVQEVSELVENISYGAHQMRDGVSLNDQRRDKQAVKPDVLMRLPNLHGFLKVAGDYPIANIKFDIKDRPSIAPDFVPLLKECG